jgi:YesN/AraC family two-component response regulator
LNPSPCPTRVVVADDESMFRASLRQLLTVPPHVIKQVYGVDVGAGFDVIGEAGSGEDAISVVRATKPDLLLVDLLMPRLTGLDVLRDLQACAADRTPWCSRPRSTGGNCLRRSASGRAASS